jgi:hypothetical protein
VVTSADVAHLAGQVGGHRVHIVGQVLPGAGDALHARLAAQLAFRAHFAGHAGHFRHEGAELVHHGVDDLAAAQELALQRPAFDLEIHSLAEVAAGHRAHHAGHFRRRRDQVGDQVIDGVDICAPRAERVREPRPLTDLSLLADLVTEPFELLGHPLIEFDHVVEGVGDFAV